MLRLGVIGDTQGNYRVDALLAVVGRHFESVDEIWHAGDWQRAEVLSGLAALGKPLVIVNGNAPDDPAYPERVRRELEGFEIGMVHRPPATWESWVQSLDICIHGHSHRWRDEIVGRTRFINVSTPTAAGFSRDRTMGILTLETGRATLERISLA